MAKKQIDGQDFDFDIEAEGNDLFAAHQLPDGYQGTDWESVNVPDSDMEDAPGEDAPGEDAPGEDAPGEDAPGAK